MLGELITMDIGTLIEKYNMLIMVIALISVVIYIISRIMYAAMFKKANVSPILSFIPIVNTIKLLDIAELPKSMFILLFIPIANIVAICRIKYEVAIRFGKGLFFTYLYLIFPIIALYLLILPSSKYTKLTEETFNNLMVEKNGPNVDPFKDFKPEIKAGAVPLEQGAVPRFEDSPIDLDVELKVVALDDEKHPDTKEEKEVHEEPVYRQFAPTVPFEEGTVAYIKPERELTTVIPYEEEKEKKEEENKINLDELPEPDTVTIVTSKKKEEYEEDILGIGSKEKENSHNDVKKRCPHCSVELDNDAKICFMCGKDV